MELSAREIQELTDLVEEIIENGGDPSIYRRGNLWRAYAKRYGNVWSDNENPVVAMREARDDWRLWRDRFSD